jgi:hypothetical protein
VTLLLLLLPLMAPGKELASTLSFLMQLSFRRLWQPYPLGDLHPQEQDIAAHMAQLGLVHTFVQVRQARRAASAAITASDGLFWPSDGLVWPSDGPMWCGGVVLMAEELPVGDVQLAMGYRSYFFFVG